MAKNSAASLLTSVDSLFTTQEERDIASQPRVQEIPIDQIDDFPNHPFKVRMDDNMIEMAASVKQHGILVPAIVRPKENGHYEMVAGHRRKLACTLIAKLQLPCIVRDLSDEEATIIMVDSNLQREQLLPSEKAFAYLLDSIQASTMLSNSEFIVMLNQAESDQERLSRLLNISPEQMSYVNGAEAGCGLMRYGNALVPFVNRFPADTELYKLITTKPGEGLFAKGQVDFNA